MAAISAGEFERIFKELYKPLCLFALRFTEKTEDAEDVVQQAFADVWDKNSHNVVIANFKSYLYQAVRNRSLTLIAQSSDTLQTTECLADIEICRKRNRYLNRNGMRASGRLSTNCLPNGRRYFCFPSGTD